MNIVGLDLSLTATGYCHPDGTTETLSSKQRGMDRIVDLRDQLAQRLVTYGDGGWPVIAPDLVVLEDYAFSRGSHAHETGELGGVVKLHLIESSQPYVLIGPSALKKAATNKGNANKIAMAVAAAKLDREFGDDNQCDAWWLRQLGLYAYDVADCALAKTAYRDEVVGKIAWPELEASDVPA